MAIMTKCHTKKLTNVVHKILFLKQHICLEPDENERAVVEQTPRILEEQLIVTFEHLLAENARGASDSNPEEDAESSLHVRRVLERSLPAGPSLPDHIDSIVSVLLRQVAAEQAANEEEDGDANEDNAPLPPQHELVLGKE